jgi:iron complex outermembrane recepter protein
MGVSMYRPATSVAAAVFVALYGAPRAAIADPSTVATGATAAALQEVVVTANRRQQSLASVPDSISVVGADQIAASGATDIPSLATPVGSLRGMVNVPLSF